MPSHTIYAADRNNPDRRILDAVTRSLTWNLSDGDVSSGEWEKLLTREWLVTNGLGGYASGTVSGALTRRFHGLLISALPSPHARTMMLNELAEEVGIGDARYELYSEETAEGKANIRCAKYLKEFRLEAGLPVWRFELGDAVLEKRLHLSYRQNTVHVGYTLLKGEAARLHLRPAVHFRPHEGQLSGVEKQTYSFNTSNEGQYEISSDGELPALRIQLEAKNATFRLDRRDTAEIRFRTEQSRGYDYLGKLWSPGYFSIDMELQRPVVVVASTEPWEVVQAMPPSQAVYSELERRRRLIGKAQSAAKDPFAAELVLAADQFLMTPEGRVADTARAHAAGDEIRSVIAGYHWFTDWGRDTMISLEGLTLTTGRINEAGFILRTFAQYIKDGLIPNLFPEGKNDGLYHTADATLWFFHAIHRYLEYSDDRATLRILLPKLREIIECHLQGTRFGIKVDEKDGLLRQGAEGYQLTWMDAKVDGWVVTPRRGKAVEINALWYNALCLMAKWLEEERSGEDSQKMAEHAARARASFNKRFWYAKGGYLYDVVDGEQGDDAACRPNQVFAISLENPVLDERHWQDVMKVVTEKLLTPVGLRSLSPDHPDYKRAYDGDLRSRDAAYHQGTVWSWLIGPFVDAYLKLHPKDLAGARRLLEGFTHHLNEACIGSVSEIFDAEPPYTPRGCIAQAWGVAELLRCWAKTAILR